MEAIIKKSILDFGIERGKPYSPSTIKIYLSNIRNLFLMCHGDGEVFDNLNWLSDYKNIEETVQHLKPTTQRNYFNSVLVALHSQLPKNEMLIKYYEGKRDVLNFNAGRQMAKSGRTDKQRDIMDKVSKSNIDALITSIDPVKIKSNHNDLMMYLVLQIHRLYPLRNEMAQMNILKRRQWNAMTKEAQLENNWLLIDATGKTGIFILNRYKTSRIHGTKHIQIDRTIMPIIRLFLRSRDIDIQDIKGDFMPPLLSYSNGNQLSRNSLSHKLSEFTKAHLGSPISTTLLAKYYSHKIEDIDNMTDTEIKAIQRESDIRGHTLNTHLTNYTQKN
tara:strand:- start:2400 stop:3395 length:996 start_codon:yes stop_codon:yes gene_type:complete